eukprot:5008575-Amphidinium_carterae.1
MLTRWPTALRAWSKKLARAIHKVPRASCAVRYLRVHPDSDASSPEVRHHCAVIESWCFSVWMERCSFEDMDNAICLAASRLVKAKRPAYVVSGPISGFLQVCIALGWTVRNAHEITDHNGVSFNLCKRTPAFMKGLAKEASRGALDCQFCAKGGWQMEGPGGVRWTPSEERSKGQKRRLSSLRTWQVAVVGLRPACTGKALRVLRRAPCADVMGVITATDS